MASPLDGQSQFPLMLGAVAGNAPGDDFAPFRDEISERSHVLVVYLQAAVGTKPAYFPPMKGTSLVASNDHGYSPYGL